MAGRCDHPLDATSLLARDVILGADERVTEISPPSSALGATDGPTRGRYGIVMTKL